MKGKVLAIFFARNAGEPMRPVIAANMIAGAGIGNDRYAKMDVTLIADEAICEANHKLNDPFSRSETRRNIVTSGITSEELNGLVGKRFRVGRAELRGTELCKPCSRPSVLAGKPGFGCGFLGLGGLVAEVLVGGLIMENDGIELAE